MTMATANSAAPPIRFSLSEIQAQSRKAARGAGMPWGLADEAAMAVRRLAALGLPGPRLLAALLLRIDGGNAAVAAAPPRTPVESSVNDALCPIRAGAMLSDRVQELLDGKTIQLAGVRCPLLVAAILCQAATPQAAFELGWRGLRIVCRSDGISVPEDAAWVATESEVALDCKACAPSATCEPTHRPSSRSRLISAEDWATLAALAHRTYVPASEASRAGAGSALSDNN